MPRPDAVDMWMAALCAHANRNTAEQAYDDHICHEQVAITCCNVERGLYGGIYYVIEHVYFQELTANNCSQKTWDLGGTNNSVFYSLISQPQLASFC